MEAEKLREFLNKWLKKEKISINQFAKLSKEYLKANQTELSPSTLTRFLGKQPNNPSSEEQPVETESGKPTIKTPRKETRELIARTIFRSKTATESDLNERIKAYFGREEKERDKVRILTGWTIWGSIGISLMKKQDLSSENPKDLAIPRGIKIAICEDPTTKQPLWIEDHKVIDELIVKKDNFPKKYIADDLYDKLKTGEADAAFLLRPTFESMVFEPAKQPVLVARIAVGHGSNIYCISKKGIGEENRNVPMVNIPQAYHAIGEFLDIIKSSFNENKEIVTIPIGNQTVAEHTEKLFADPAIEKILNRREETISFSDSSSYEKSVERLEGYILDNKTIMIIAFEPLTNTIFSKLAKKLDGKCSIKYTNFNLSKLVDSRTSYGLYATPALIEDKTRFQVVVDFLKAIESYQKSFSTPEALHRDIYTSVANMYYSVNNDDLTPNDMMKNALSEISFSVQFLPFLELFQKLR